MIDMKDMIKELREIIKDEYDFIIKIEPIGFTVLLSKEIYEDFEIAITYGFEEFPYVNFEHLNDYLKSNNESLRDLDYGYDRNDIEVIFNVMKWMEENSEYINELNSFCDKESYHEL